MVGVANSGFAGFIYQVESQALEYLGSVSDGTYRNVGLAISSDGSVVTGRGRRSDGTQEAFFYDTTTLEVTYSGSLPDARGFDVAWDLSSDGSHVAGQRDLGGGRIPFVYDLLGNTAIPVPVGGVGPAGGISGDGTLIVGHHTTNRGIRGFVYDRLTGNHVDLDDFPGGRDYSAATAISADGSTVIGASDTDEGLEPFVYDVATGTTTRLGGLFDDTSLTYAGVVPTKDGAVIIGYSPNDIVIYEYKVGMRSLEEVLVQSINFDGQLTGFTIEGIGAVSENGRTLVGWGSISTGPHAGEGRAWVAVIPETLNCNRCRQRNVIYRRV